MTQTSQQPSLPTLASRIADIRRLPGAVLRAFERRDVVTRMIVEGLRNKGKFFRTALGEFYFDHESARILPLEEESGTLSAFLYEKFGLNVAEKREFEHLLTGLRNEAFARGEEVQVRRLAHFDPDTKHLYVSRFNGQIYRLDGENIAIGQNGDDGVFFWDDPSWKPYDLIRFPIGSLQKLVINSANLHPSTQLSSEDQRWLFRTWLYSQFFDTMHPTKPLLLVCGEKGGGKTACLRKWLKLLFGQAGEVTALESSKPDGFVAAVCSLPVVAFDNVDSRISWLPDMLASLATGMSIRRRALYTTNDVIPFVPQCWVALTSRTPKFIENRDDVLDRTIILITERRKTFKSEQVLLREIEDQRNALWTELLFKLNNIVMAIRRQADSPEVSYRMADFASFALIVGEVEGSRQKAAGVLGRLEQAQTDALCKEEPIAICLRHWLEITDNCGRRINSADLRRELAKIAADEQVGWPYPAPKSLGQRLSHITTNLRSLFEIEIEQDTAKQNWYRFWPKRRPESAESCQN